MTLFILSLCAFYSTNGCIIIAMFFLGLRASQTLVVDDLEVKSDLDKRGRLISER